jgi:hypothetical protein
VNQITEARGLKRRYEGKSKGEVRIRIRARTEVAMMVIIRIKVAEWVPSIYLAIINK